MMQIEGAIAASAAVSSHMLAGEANVIGRDRLQVEQIRLQAINAPDANVLAASMRAVGPRVLAGAIKAVERAFAEMDEDLELLVKKDPDGRRLTVVIRNRRSGKPIREIPADRFLEAVSLAEQRVAGLFVDERQ